MGFKIIVQALRAELDKGPTEHLNSQRLAPHAVRPISLEAQAIQLKLFLRDTCKQCGGIAESVRPGSKISSVNVRISAEFPGADSSVIVSVASKISLTHFIVVKGQMRRQHVAGHAAVPLFLRGRPRFLLGFAALTDFEEAASSIIAAPAREAQSLMLNGLSGL